MLQEQSRGSVSATLPVTRPTLCTVWLQQTTDTVCMKYIVQNAHAVKSTSFTFTYGYDLKCITFTCNWECKNVVNKIFIVLDVYSGGYDDDNIIPLETVQEATQLLDTYFTSANKTTTTTLIWYTIKLITCIHHMCLQYCTKKKKKKKKLWNHYQMLCGFNRLTWYSC